MIREGYEHFAKQSIGLDEDVEIRISNMAGPTRKDGLEVRSFQPPLSLLFHVEEGKFVPR
jgi:hypothetical protein